MDFRDKACAGFFLCICRRGNAYAVPCLNTVMVAMKGILHVRFFFAYKYSFTAFKFHVDDNTTLR